MKQVAAGFYELKQNILLSNLHPDYIEPYFKALDISQQVFFNFIQAKTQDFIARKTPSSVEDQLRALTTRLLCLEKVKIEFLEMIGRINHEIVKETDLTGKTKKLFRKQEAERLSRMQAIDSQTSLFRTSLIALQIKLQNIFRDCVVYTAPAKF